jgi:hypothetical protein
MSQHKNLLGQALANVRREMIYAMNLPKVTLGESGRETVTARSQIPYQLERLVISVRADPPRWASWVAKYLGWIALPWIGWEYDVWHAPLPKRIGLRFRLLRPAWSVYSIALGRRQRTAKGQAVVSSLGVGTYELLASPVSTEIFSETSIAVRIEAPPCIASAPISVTLEGSGGPFVVVALLRSPQELH